MCQLCIRCQSDAWCCEECEDETEMTKPFDPSKPVQTRDGRKARIICTDRKSAHNIVALITYDDGNEYCELYRSNGKFLLTNIHELDLVNVQEKRWVNLYPHESLQDHTRIGYAYKTKKDAMDHASDDLIACVEVDWTE